MATFTVRVDEGGSGEPVGGEAQAGEVGVNLERGEEAAEGGAGFEESGEGEVVGMDCMGLHAGEEGEGSLGILSGIFGNEGVPMEGVLVGDGAVVPSSCFANHHIVL